MTELESWLQQATRTLSSDSVARVRTEIQEHYESACQAAIHSGASASEAAHLALTALGDPKRANCRYRQVLLTSAEARILRQGNQEARAFCSRPWLKGLLLALPVAALFLSVALYVLGITTAARVLVLVGMATGFLFAAPFLPVYTVPRARAFRIAKWLVVTGVMALAFRSDAPAWSWLLMSCVWPLAWTEWTRYSIRRKLPVARWPRQLYL